MAAFPSSLSIFPMHASLARTTDTPSWVFQDDSTPGRQIPSRNQKATTESLVGLQLLCQDRHSNRAGATPVPVGRDAGGGERERALMHNPTSDRPLSAKDVAAAAQQRFDE